MELNLIAKALAVFGPCIGAAIGIGLIAGKATESMARQPEMAGKIQTIALIAFALAEATAIYGLLIALII